MAPAGKASRHFCVKVKINIGVYWSRIQGEFFTAISLPTRPPPHLFYTIERKSAKIKRFIGCSINLFPVCRHVQIVFSVWRYFIWSRLICYVIDLAFPPKKISTQQLTNLLAEFYNLMFKVKKGLSVRSQMDKIRCLYTQFKFVEWTLAVDVFWKYDRFLFWFFYV
jgi:hypothetical protein